MMPKLKTVNSTFNFFCGDGCASAVNTKDETNYLALKHFDITEIVLCKGPTTHCRSLESADVVSSTPAVYYRLEHQPSQLKLIKISVCFFFTFHHIHFTIFTWLGYSRINYICNYDYYFLPIVQLRGTHAVQSDMQ